MKTVLFCLVMSFAFVLGCGDNADDKEQPSIEAVQQLIQGLTVLYTDTDNVDAARTLYEMEEGLFRAQNQALTSPLTVFASSLPSVEAMCPPVPVMVLNTTTTTWESCDIGNNISLDGSVVVDDQDPNQSFDVELNIDTTTVESEGTIYTVRLECEDLTIGPHVLEGRLRTDFARNNNTTLRSLITDFNITEFDDTNCPIEGFMTVRFFEEISGNKIEFGAPCGEVTITEF